VTYTIGGHGLQRGTFHIDPNLLLFHLHYVTPDYSERMAARQDIVAAAKARNAEAEDKVDLPRRYWINWSNPAYIRDKDLGNFGRATRMDVSSGFEDAARRLRNATVKQGRKLVIEPDIINQEPQHIVLPEHLRSAIEDRV
jgi:hypothetical protein